MLGFKLFLLHSQYLRRDAGKPGTLRNETEPNGTEPNGTEPEVTDAQYGCGRRIRVGNLVLICQLINVRRAHLASCTSHEDRTSNQQTV